MSKFLAALTGVETCHREILGAVSIIYEQSPKVYSMRKRSIVIKLVAVVCGTVFVLLISGSVGLIMLEIDLVDRLTGEHEQVMQRSIDKRERTEKAELHKNISFNANIFSKVIGGHLYRLSLEHLKVELYTYMEYPEILAIQIRNEDDEPVAAAWKNSEILIDDVLPENFRSNEHLSVRFDSIFNEEIVGNFELYYTETPLTEEIKQIKTHAQAETETFRNNSRARLKRVIVIQVTGLAVILLILVLCQIFSLKALILKPLLEISKVARKLSEFDLTVSIQAAAHDEIGQLFIAINEVARSFKKVVSLVQRSGLQVFSSATELSGAAKQQEVTLTHQVESTQKAVKSIEKISHVAADLVQTMQRVASMSQETAEFANSGQTDLARMEEAMRHMEHASQSISGRLETINDKTEKITNVVTTITKVADQTNLLSLNAAIEAEKAGEFGRGFTVVAREIRRLADQTAVATLDIEQMVREMQAAVSAGVMEMDKFIADVRASSGDVEKISTQLTRIIRQVQDLSPSFEDVTVTMGHQSDDAQAINRTMMTLSEEMQETTSSLRASYVAIARLNEAARGLQDEVSRFKVT